jgi:hypothetical protein
VTTARESSEQHLGKHTLRFEPPDVYCITFVGDVSASEMIEYHAALTRFAEGKRWLLAVGDLSRTASFSAEARRELVHLPPFVRGVGTFGMSTQVRLAVSLVYKAFTLLRRNSDTTVAFVETEAEARAWVAERRRELERSDT